MQQKVYRTAHSICLMESTPEMIKAAQEALSEYTAELRQYQIKTAVYERLSARYKIDPADLTGFINMALSLLSVPTDGTALVHCRRAMLILVEEIVLRSAAKEGIELVIAILNDFFDDMESDHENTKTQTKKISITKEPCFALYMEAFDSVEPVTEAVRDTCFRFFCRMMAAVLKTEETKKHQISTKEHYTRALRNFLKYLPAEIKQSAQYRYSDRAMYVKAAIANFDLRHCNNKSSELTATAKNYLDLLDRAICRQEFGHGRDELQVKESRNKDVSGEGAGDGDQKKTKKRIPPLIEVPREKKGTGDDEELPDEFIWSGGPPSMGVVSRPPHLDFRLADALHLRYYHLFFDDEFLNLYHYALIHLATEEAWQEAPFQKRAAMFTTLMSMHTGSDPSDICNLAYGCDDKSLDFEQNPLYLLKQSDRYVLYRKAPVERISEDHKKAGQPVTTLVRFTLPPYLAHYLNNSKFNSKTAGYVFAESDSASKPEINIDGIRAWLKILNKKYTLNLTPKRLKRSFFPFFVGRCMLDPIESCYISGQDMMLYSAPLHYVRISANTIESSYLRVAKLAANKIGRNLDLMLKEGYVSDSASAHIVRQILLDCWPIDQQYKGLAYGSPYVPAVNDLRKYLDKLGSKITKLRWRNIITRHNLYICLLAICFQFSFAHRSRNEMPYALEELIDRSHITIQDKDSARYREYRELPVNRILRQYCVNMKKSEELVCDYIAMKLRPEIMKELRPSALSFISQEGHWESFSVKKFNAVLNDSDCKYPFDQKMPRHFVRTVLQDKGFPSEISNAVLGHTHVAREPLGICSAFSLGAFGELFRGFIEKLLTEVGFPSVAYTPGSRND